MDTKYKVNDIVEVNLREGFYDAKITRINGNNETCEIMLTKMVGPNEIRPKTLSKSVDNVSISATDIENYEKKFAWELKKNEEYYDKNGVYIGNLVEKEVLTRRTFSPYYEGFTPGRYNLTFSTGNEFKEVLDSTTYGIHDVFFYKKPTKGGRNHKQNKSRKTKKSRK